MFSHCWNLLWCTEILFNISRTGQHTSCCEKDYLKPWSLKLWERKFPNSKHFKLVVQGKIMQKHMSLMKAYHMACYTFLESEFSFLRIRFLEIVLYVMIKAYIPPLYHGYTYMIICLHFCFLSSKIILLKELSHPVFSLLLRWKV